MLVRVVRMRIAAGREAEFVRIFEQSRAEILAFPGCSALRLHREQDASSCYVTISRWDDARRLEAYRASKLFRRVWAQASATFAQPAQAWSLQELEPGQEL